MGTVRIKGNNNIVGNDNSQVIMKITSGANSEMLALLSKLLEDREDLKKELEAVQDQAAPIESRKRAASKLGAFLKGTAQEGGRALLQWMIGSGLEWATLIATAAEKQ